MAEEVDEEESLARFCDIDVPIATQDIRASEQSTDVLSDDDRHVNVLHVDWTVGVVHDISSTHAKRAISEQRSD